MSHPSPEEVKKIYKATYDFFMKHKNCKTDYQFDKMVNEAGDIHDNNNFELCEVILSELMSAINYYNRRE